jgi:hypothetical protein
MRLCRPHVLRSRHYTHTVLVDTPKINPAHVHELTSDLKDKIIHVTAEGDVKEDTKNAEKLAPKLRSGDSISVLAAVKTALYIWQVDVDPDNQFSETNKPGLTENHPHQRVVLAPGTARLKKPNASGPDLSIRVWLQGSHEDVVIAEYQTEKTLVRYANELETKVCSLNASGHWKKVGPKRVTPAEQIPFAPSAVETNGTTNDTSAKTAFSDTLKPGRTLQAPLTAGGPFRR